MYSNVAVRPMVLVYLFGICSCPDLVPVLLLRHERGRGQQEDTAQPTVSIHFHEHNCTRHSSDLDGERLQR